MPSVELYLNGRKKKLGFSLWLIRVDNNWTQKEFAQFVNIPIKLLGQIENGQMEVPLYRYRKIISLFVSFLKMSHREFGDYINQYFPTDDEEELDKIKSKIKKKLVVDKRRIKDGNFSVDHSHYARRDDICSVSTSGQTQKVQAKA